MKTRSLAIGTLFVLSGCVSRAPAPVVDTPASRQVETPRSAAAARPLAAGKTHLVGKGDTLNSIARQYSLSPRDVAAWNGIDNPNRITPGQTLRLGPPAETAGQAIEVRPVAGGAPVARALDDAPPAPPGKPETPLAVSSAPTVAADSEPIKRTPKGGKLPFSEENHARLKMLETPAAPVPVAVVPEAAPKPVEKPAAPLTPAAPADASIDWQWPTAGKMLAGFSDNAGEANKGINLAGKPGDPVHAAAAGKVIYVGTMNKYGNLIIVLHAGGHSSVYAHNSKIVAKEGQMVARGQKIAELGDSDADQPKLHFEIRQQGKPVDPLKFLPTR